jgi:hypothetical protein
MRVQAIIVIALAAAVIGCRTTPSAAQLEPTPPERTDMTSVARTIPRHEALAGTEARTALLFSHPIPGLAAHVEVREYYVSQGKELALTPPNEALFEVRSGRFDVRAPGVEGEHGTGTSWIAGPGDRVVVRTTGEMAILRATYVVKD